MSTVHEQLAKDDPSRNAVTVDQAIGTWSIRPKSGAKHGGGRQGKKTVDLAANRKLSGTLLRIMLPSAPGEETPFDRIIALTRQGHMPEVACGTEGVLKGTFVAWMHQGQLDVRFYDGDELEAEKNSLHARFFLNINRAISLADVDDMQFIEGARFKDWKAAHMRLRSRTPGRYDDKAGNTAVNVNVGTTSPDEKDAHDVKDLVEKGGQKAFDLMQELLLLGEGESKDDKDPDVLDAELVEDKA